MDAFRLGVDPDIRRAVMPDPALYSDPRWFDVLCLRVLARSWHWIEEAHHLSDSVNLVPFVLLPNCLNEPMLLARDETGRTRALSNVCTHRGAIVRSAVGHARGLRCPYHGRRFALDGRCLSSPGFEGLDAFPSAAEHLSAGACESWRGLTFAGLHPQASWEEITGGLEQRLGWLPWRATAPLPSRSRDFQVRAHWTLYCENYLEGLHVPYVHPGLCSAIELDRYSTELFPWGSLQVAEARSGQCAFEPPPASPDHGRRIAGYYAYVFPSTMLNYYPWGLSLNAVRPRSPELTQVSFRSYVWDEDKLERGAGAGLDEVEAEDERMVESVHSAVAAGLRVRGRYAPHHERAVHQFHLLLDGMLARGE